MSPLGKGWKELPKVPWYLSSFKGNQLLLNGYICWENLQCSRISYFLNYIQVETIFSKLDELILLKSQEVFDGQRSGKSMQVTQSNYPIDIISSEYVLSSIFTNPKNVVSTLSGSLLNSIILILICLFKQ